MYVLAFLGVTHNPKGEYCGVKGAGKDTFCNALSLYLAQLGVSCSCVAFADPLKRVLHDIMNVSEELLWGPSELREVDIPELLNADGKALSARKALFSVSSLTNLFQEPWLNYTARAVHTLSRSGKYDRLEGVIPGKTDVVLISDLRKPAELEWLQSLPCRGIHPYIFSITREVDREPQTEYMNDMLASLSFPSIPNDAGTRELQEKAMTVALACLHHTLDSLSFT